MAATIGAARIEMSINSAEFNARMKRMVAEVGKFRRSLANMERNFNRWGRNLESTGRRMTTNFTLPAIAAGGAAVKAAIDFESAFAGVRKTVSATESEFAGLRSGILQMSKEIPTSANEIAGIAEAAGQLGIRTESIMGFTRVMADLGVTTNMSSEQAATSLARLANITQMSQDEFDRLGSVIVDLGNNLATTEGEIVEMAQRLAGSARQAGLAEPEILAIAGALSSVGIEAQAGGTAFSKVMDEINLAVQTGSSRLAEFADVAGVSTEAFAQTFREDASGAIIQFVEGLGQMEERGGSAIATLEQMGITERRMRDALLRASGAGDLLRRSIELGTKAWAENTALTEEAQQRYNTMASRLQKLKNRIVALGISVGDALMPAVSSAIEMVGKMTQAFEDLSAGAKVEVLAIAGLFAASGPFVWAMGKAAKIVAGLVGFVRTKFALMAAGVGLVVTAGQWLIDNWSVFAAEFEKILAEMEIRTLATMRDINKILTLNPMNTVLSAQAEANVIFFESEIDRVKEEYENLVRFQKNMGLTSFIESAGNAWDGFANSIEKMLGMSIEGTALEEFLDSMKGSFEAAAAASAEVVTNTNRISGASLTGGSLSMGGKIPSGNLGTASVDIMEKTKQMSKSVRLALGLIPGQVGEAKASMAGFSEDLANNIVPMISQAMGNAAGAFLEMSAAAAVSGGSLKTVFYQVLTSLADLAIRVGKIAIATGLAIEGIKKALQSLNPVAAIAAGAALIALGATVKAALSRAANSGGEESSGSNIPGMANGGIVPPGFPGDSYPAMLTSGERVIPDPIPLNRGGSVGGMSKRDMSQAMFDALRRVGWEVRGDKLKLVQARGGRRYG